MTTLEGISHSQGHRFSLLDKLYMGLAWGFGHGACHATFFFMSLLPLTTGSGTFYQAACPQFSMSLIGALYSLAFGMILTRWEVAAVCVRGVAHGLACRRGGGEEGGGCVRAGG